MSVRRSGSASARARRIDGLPALIDSRCRVLVLGSVPSERSLETQSYYAHPRNLFWSIMGHLHGAGPELGYAERVRRLLSAGVGVWDVLAGCERSGSLDSRIVAGSERPNALADLLAEHPAIAAIGLNGGTAHRLFERRIVPTLPAAVVAHLSIVALPSTSPAHASMSTSEKLERWSALLAWAPAAGDSRR